MKLVALVLLAVLSAVVVGLQEVTDEDFEKYSIKVPASYDPKAKTTGRPPVPKDGMYLGLRLDSGAPQGSPYNQRKWQNRLDKIEHETLKVNHSVIVMPFNFPVQKWLGANDVKSIVGLVEECKRRGCLPMFGLRMHTGIRYYPEDVDKLAKLLGGFNYPMFVRILDEMNGEWTPWGLNSELYSSHFTRIAKALRKHAPRVATVWSPAAGDGYPFTDNKLTRKELEDTNGDGKLDVNDSYEPYWPEDEDEDEDEDLVDWVGMNAFWWGWTDKFDKGGKIGYNVLPDGYRLAEVYKLGKFYEEFVFKKNLPFFLTETSILYDIRDTLWIKNSDDVNEVTQKELKTEWLDQVYNRTRAMGYPMHGAAWTELVRTEVVEDDKIQVDWRIGGDQSSVKFYRNLVRGDTNTYVQACPLIASGKCQGYEYPQQQKEFQKLNKKKQKEQLKLYEQRLEDDKQFQEEIFFNLDASQKKDFNYNETELFALMVDGGAGARSAVIAIVTIFSTLAIVYTSF